MIDAERIRHLEKKLAELEDDPEARIREKIDMLNDLAWLLADTDMKRSLTLSESAYRLATSGGGNGPPYKEGMAYSLRTQGHFNVRLGNHSASLVQLMKAQEIFKSLGIIEGLPDVYDGIAGLYFQIGSFPNSLTYVYRQMDAAMQIGDKRLLADAYNRLSDVYVELEDYEQGEATRNQCLELAIESGYTRIKCLSYINIATMRLRTDRYQQALEFGSRGYNLSREAGFELFELYSLVILGKIYLKLGETGKGLKTLESVLALSRKIDAKPSECVILLSLGETYLEMQELDRAVEYLEHSLSVAQSIDASVEVYKAHQAFSKAYEQKGNFPEALVHYKQYQAIRGQVLSNVETLRTKILEITYQTEAAKKEAEIEHLRAIELEREVDARTVELSNTVKLLQREINERKRAEEEIQHMVELLEERVADRSRELAALYDMTILFTEAQNLTDTLEPALASICQNVGGSGITVHIMMTDKSQLQLTAHLYLEEWVNIQQIALTTDFANWLGQTDTPLMVTENTSDYSFLPQELLLPAHPTYFAIPLRVRKEVIGLLGVYQREKVLFNVQAVSLLVTIAEQLGIIIQNQRLQEQTIDITRMIERQRLSRELHDSVAQRIYSLHLFANAGYEALLLEDDRDDALLRFQQVDANALYALREMRLLLYQLRPLELESQTLFDAFENRFDLVERRLGITATIEEKSTIELSENITEEIYFIITEALNNALKHAEATEIKLIFTVVNGRSQIVIQDNGCGFDPEQISAGLGLENMRLRAEKINGLVTIDTTIGQGTTVRIMV